MEWGNFKDNADVIFDLHKLSRSLQRVFAQYSTPHIHKNYYVTPTLDKIENSIKEEKERMKKKH